MNTIQKIAAALAVTATLALAACGGPSESEVKSAIMETVEAANGAMMGLAKVTVDHLEIDKIEAAEDRGEGVYAVHYSAKTTTSGLGQKVSQTHVEVEYVKEIGGKWEVVN